MSSFFSGKSSNSSSSSSINKLNVEAGPVTSKILTEPAPEASPKKKWEYDEAQLQKIKELKEYTKTIALPQEDPYYPWEQRFLNDPGCHPRFMRAAKWKLEDGKKRIKGTIEWRREYKPELLKPDEIGVEAETGKIVLSGFDSDARPIIYMRPGRENTKPSDRQIQHLIYILERAIDLMPPGQEQVAIIVDFASATSASNPSIGTARKVLNILQNHYVERMGRAVVVRIPWWVNAFFTGITPFMDPITRDKIRFNPKLAEIVPLSHLDKEFGGEYNFEFEYKTYWDTLTEFCHISPSGGRLDAQGNPTVPPLGNGAKAAYEGFIPHPEAVSTGSLVPANEGHQPSSSDSSTPQAVGSSVADGGGVKSNQEAGKDDKKNEDGLVDGVNGLIIQPPTLDTAPGKPEGEAVFDHPPSKGEVEIARKSLEVK